KSRMAGSGPQGAGAARPEGTVTASSSSSERRPRTPCKAAAASSSSTSARSTSPSSAFGLRRLPLGDVDGSSSSTTTWLPVSSSATTSLSSRAIASTSAFSTSVSDSRATASLPDSSVIGGISKSVSKMSPLLCSPAMAAASRLDPSPESSRVSSNSLSESEVIGSLPGLRPPLPPSRPLETPGSASSASSKSTSESLSAGGFGGFLSPLPESGFFGSDFFSLASESGFLSPLPESDFLPFSRETPLSPGDLRLMPLLPARTASSTGELPRSTSSLESVFNWSSKSSLSASRLSSNSLLSPVPWPALPSDFGASVPAEILPDDLGADNLAELPPLMTALLGPPLASSAISSVGTASGSVVLLCLCFGILLISRRTSESLDESPVLFGGAFPESAESEKMSSSEASKISGSSALEALLGFLVFGSTLKSSEP